MNISDRKIDLLITTTETGDGNLFITQIDKGNLHVAKRRGDVLDSIKEEFESICRDKNNWVIMEGK